jgi:ADP-heptose:LPS heptosyltransferase
LVKSQILISNETGTAHIANAVGTPTVCILGGGHFGRFVPYPVLSGQTSHLKVVYHKMPCYGCDWKCVYQIKSEASGSGAMEDEPAPCISNISVDAVWNEVKPLLSH